MSDTTDVLPDSARESAEPQTPTSSVDAGSPRRRRSGTGLSAMLLPELQAMASSLGIQGVGRLRKGQLIAAIQNVQTPAGAAGGAAATAARPAAAASEAQPAPQPARSTSAPSAKAGDAVNPPVSSPAPSAEAAAPAEGTMRVRTRRGASRASGSPSTAGGEQTTLTDALSGSRETRGGASTPGPESGSENVRAASTEEAAPAAAPPVVTTPATAPSITPAEPSVAGVPVTSVAEPASVPRVSENGSGRGRDDRRERQQVDGERASADRPAAAERQGRQQGDRQGRGSADRGQADRGQADRGQADRGQADRSQADRGQADRDDEFGGGNRRNRGRFRERGRNRGRQGGGFSESEPIVREDDVLVPVAGILDVLDNYAFVRTSGYLTGPTDVYVSLAQVRRHGLRRGDAITGVVRAPQEGEQRRDKYNALVRLDTVNGLEPDEARNRPEFTKLTPLYPQERLRLETEPQLLTTRVIDLVMPLGKGQRALIVSPPKAGKTMVLQAIANAITTNNPECHLMVVLVDERPEEVTDMQRSVKGEVIASTFDRPPSDHTSVAELSIERAKRLVELGEDVVVLLDSITRLGRAYNLAAPASGRILSGGVDSTALYPPKRFLGAARNIENGGSLTIIATALVETGSTMDTVIFEEFKGTGNAELKLDRKIADKRIFPAIDVDPSGTRKEDILLAPDELVIMHKLRRVLHTLESQQALDLLLERLKKTRTNYEFLMQIATATPGQD
ncbi:transcription termination factor Rho [Frankia sp. CiP3]|uniref:transcription termination factor Rho n=1 Tax=Frankia sp. CiP3 TaxID=2880971 RepID=UPI001EF62692|nr:transcription termination factor Rho [Frankia sp. CiP3]